MFFTVSPPGRASRLPDFRRAETATATINVPPNYTSLLDSTVSVAQLWEEWTEGRCGRLSVREMNNQHKRLKWVEESHKKFFRRREAIIQAIESCHSFSDASPTAAVSEIERQRGGKSLHQSGQELVSQRHAAKKGTSG